MAYANFAVACTFAEGHAFTARVAATRSEFHIVQAWLAAEPGDHAMISHARLHAREPSTGAITPLPAAPAPSTPSK